jgi:hypothetical protein
VPGERRRAINRLAAEMLEVDGVGHGMTLSDRRLQRLRRPRGPSGLNPKSLLKLACNTLDVAIDIGGGAAQDIYPVRSVGEQTTVLTKKEN